MFLYRFTQAAAWIVSKAFFKRKVVRNELKGKKGPIVVIANHQAALDFVNLISSVRQPMRFVISNSFYKTMPVKGIMTKIGVIPKQQFQTSLKDMHSMKAVIDSNEILAIYPAGLMCEDGISTPIPIATYRFLQWLQADIYVAKTSGTYFCTPKWSKKNRAGRTYLDIYKLFSKEELATLSNEEIRERADEALLFDAYREQETLKVKYCHGDNIEGLENVLYLCPHCKREYTVRVRDKHTIYCTECGFAEKSDKYGFLHKEGEVGEELRYVSDWSRLVHDDLKARMSDGECAELSCGTKFLTVNEKKKKFVESGEGTVTLTADKFILSGTMNGEEICLEIPSKMFPSLPFKPGKYIEIQHNDDIIRCMLDDGKLAMKFINMLKINHEIFEDEHCHV